MRLIFLLIFCSSLSTQALELTGLDAKIQTYIQSNQQVKNSGIAIGVIHGGQLVFFGGYGYRDRAAKLPVTQQTLFRIASNTKSFWSTTLGILSDQGKIKFDQPVRDLLPKFALESESAAKQATLTDLLSHRVGLPRHDVMWYLAPFTREQIFERLPFLEMNKRPEYGFRGKWQYNNLMFMTLGLLAEAADGRPWSKIVQDEILQPLAMNNTVFSVADMIKASDYALPYWQNDLLPWREHASMGPAGVMVSNVEDLSKWVALLLNEGKMYSGRQLVSPAAQARLFRPESEEYYPGIDVKIRYGLGWTLAEIQGRRVNWHDGGIDGFSTFVSFMPEADLGLIILVNQDEAGDMQFPYTTKKNGVETKMMPVVIYEHLLGVSGGAPAGSVGLPTATVADHSAAMQSVHELMARPRLPMINWFQRFDVDVTEQRVSVGKFQHPAYGDLEIFQNSGGFIFLYYGFSFPLKATPEPDKYKIAGWEIPVEIERKDGKVSVVHAALEPKVSAIKFVRTN
jgi:CubicO group peptidase (beta-lactamase class C family)